MKEHTFQIIFESTMAITVKHFDNRTIWVIILFGLVLMLAGCLRRSEKRQDSTAKFKIIDAKQLGQGAGLMNTESVVYDAENDYLYASNGKGYGEGIDGFISKLSLTGGLLELNWISGLNRPTGMAIYDQHLYVADVSSIKVIDLQTGSITTTIQEPIPNSGLNDVAIGKKGEVFVTASFVHAVFKIENDVLVEWVKEEELLKWANGLIIEDEKLIVAGQYLTAITIETKEIVQIDLNPMVEDFDGLWSDGKGGYFASTVANSALWHINSLYKVSRLKASEDYFGDLQFIPEEKLIYVARGKKETTDSYISSFGLN